MSDYLTEEVVEKAARAEWEYEWPDWSWERMPDNLRDFYMSIVRAALSAVLPDIIQQARTDALTSAATAYQWGGWADDPQVRGDLVVRRRQVEHAVKWFCDRAYREVER